MYQPDSNKSEQSKRTKHVIYEGNVSSVISTMAVLLENHDKNYLKLAECGEVQEELLGMIIKAIGEVITILRCHEALRCPG